MSNPEFVGQQCDGCERYLRDVGVVRPIYKLSPNPYWATKFVNHQECYAHAKAAGWYIAEKDLCPDCASKMEVPQ